MTDFDLLRLLIFWATAYYIAGFAKAAADDFRRWRIERRLDTIMRRARRAQHNRQAWLEIAEGLKRMGTR